jgi:hypothetical protein
VQPSTIIAAFPAELADDVRSVSAVLPVAGLAPVDPFTVDVRGETLTIPARIYHPEPDPAAEHALTPAQRLILHCLYTRHHDGWVRQRRLEQVVASDAAWVVPFVVQLAGEYVLEIVRAITLGLPGLDVPHSATRRLYGEFVVRNPAFFARTEQRVVSYWDCYYRRRYPEFGSYPGRVLIAAFRAAASEHAGMPG